MLTALYWLVAAVLALLGVGSVLLVVLATGAAVSAWRYERQVEEEAARVAVFSACWCSRCQPPQWVLELDPESPCR